jgi:uncharacterized phage protein (TIGR01671 family)
MEEIKFRGWNGHEMMEMDDMNMNHSLDLHNLGHRSQITLLQYTGLKDKNEKEICEGDVCVINPDDDSYKDIVVKDKNWIELSRYKNRCVTNCSLYEHHSMIEVVGNIYEHPNLMSDSNAV